MVESALVSERFAQRVARDLKAQVPVSDKRFDMLFPPEVRVHSKIHFTPMKVALKTREWLDSSPGINMLDVGSGCGKFCLIFAASGKGSVTGIEQRPTLHRVAEDTSRSMGLTDVRFLCGRMENLDWSEFNMFYFFNPFYERIAHRSGMDDRTPYNAGLFFEHVKTVRDKLSTVRSGSRVVTYHGMGGHLANDWQMIRSDDICTDEIQLWVKA